MKFLLAAVAILFPITAGAQAVLQAGPNAPGHVPMYIGGFGNSQTIVQDAGGAGGGPSGNNLSELGITSRSPTNTYPSANSGNGPYATHDCRFDAPTTNPTGYHFLCFDPNAQGGGLIAYGAGGTASQLPLNIIVNGVTYPFPFIVGGGGVVGPPSTTIGDIAAWNNTVGTLLKDIPVTGIGSVVEATAPALTGPILFAPVISGCTGIASGNGSSAVTCAPSSVANVQDPRFGAKGDGVTDDTVAINAAATSLATTGGTLYFPCALPGEFYKISNPINLGSNLRVTGAGYCSTVKTISAGWLLVSTNFGMLNIVGQTNIVIDHMHVVGTTTAADINHTPKFIFGDGFDNVDIHDNWLEQSGFEGIWEGGNAATNTHLHVHDNYINAAGITTGLQAIQIAANYATVENNIIRNSGSCVGAGSQHVLVSGNLCEYPLAAGMGSGDGCNAADMLFTGNLILLNPAVAIGGVGVEGFLFGYGSPSATLCTIPAGNETQVIGNRIAIIAAPSGSTYARGIFGGTQNTPLWGSIQDNVIDIVGSGQGIQVQGAVNGANYTITNNVVRVYNESGISYGIQGIPNLLASGNVSISSASPAVVGYVGHGIPVGGAFQFTGTVPTGVSINTPYYVISAGYGANTFEFSTTAGGSAINSSGSASTTAVVNAWGVLTINSSGNKVYGLTTGAYGSYGIDYVTSGNLPALLTLTEISDFQDGGYYQAYAVAGNTGNIIAGQKNNIAINYPQVSRNWAAATFTAGSTTPAFNTAFTSNISSITRNSTGNYSVTFTTATLGTVYSIQLTPIYTGCGHVLPEVSSSGQTTAGFTFTTVNLSGSATDFCSMNLNVTQLF